MAQLYAILTTLGIATGGGVITGWLLTIRSMRRLENLTWYEDSEYFENAVDSEGLTHVPNEPEAANRNQSIQMKTRSDNHKVITVY
ncbi:unnamed protein product [Notodromas monacha]|uniref:Uncharacterized protein n=1 Tax=Notodromas monacha TaxID=399045 RepID=A0A7R9GKU2_9CRUS|nr:unnamed protein product [Notodromas monacha]CAG0925168.1 unnamed protein product [Notodromas monacha]